jgi:uncharacterized protein YegL
MKSKFTKITIVLDRSGSMDNIMSDMLGGLNKFIQDQKNLANAGTAEVSLYSFSDTLNVVFEHVPIDKVRPVTIDQVEPDGSTALNDSLAKVIDNLGAYLANLNESDRPEKVLNLIITDGLENCSRKFTREQVREKIKHQSEKYNWDFVYLGANQDAWEESHTLGISQKASLTYAATSIGANALFDTLNERTSFYRSAQGNVQYSFAPEDTARQKSAGA